MRLKRIEGKNIMVTIGFCEDNELQREIMQNFLLDYVKTRAVTYTVFESGEDLLRHVKEKGGFDIYILDIVMPGISGMEAAVSLRQMYDTGHIIFTTASTEYAAMSYDVDAFYYLTKPIDPAKLYRILDKACATLNPEEDVINIRTKNGDMRLKVENIMYVELKDRAPFFYLADGRVCEGVKLRAGFDKVVAPLMGDTLFTFCGVSRIVNLKYVDALDSESLLLYNGTQLYFPRSAYPDIKKLWKNNRK